MAVSLVFMGFLPGLFCPENRPIEQQACIACRLVKATSNTVPCGSEPSPRTPFAKPSLPPETRGNGNVKNGDHEGVHVADREVALTNAQLLGDGRGSLGRGLLPDGLVGRDL